MRAIFFPCLPQTNSFYHNTSFMFDAIRTYLEVFEYNTQGCALAVPGCIRWLKFHCGWLGKKTTGSTDWHSFLNFSCVKTGKIPLPWGLGTLLDTFVGSLTPFIEYVYHYTVQWVFRYFWIFCHVKNNVVYIIVLVVLNMTNFLHTLTSFMI